MTSKETDARIRIDKMLIEASCFYNLGKIEKAQDLYVKITNRIP